MGYYNPIYVYPNERFLDDAKAAGVDGLIVVDLPPEADDELCLPATKRGSTSSASPRRRPTPSGSRPCSQHLGLPLLRVDHRHHRRRRALMLTVFTITFGGLRRRQPSRGGRFWRKKPDQAKALGAVADAVVVGSALVGAIEKSLGADGRSTSKTVPAVLDLVGSLAAALRAD